MAGRRGEDEIKQAFPAEVPNWIDGREVPGRSPHELISLGLARTFQECRVFPDETCLDNLLFSAQPKAMGGAIWQVATRRAPRCESARRAA